MRTGGAGLTWCLAWVVGGAVRWSNACPDEWWIQIKSTRNSPWSDALWCGVWKSKHVDDN